MCVQKIVDYFYNRRRGAVIPNAFGIDMSYWQYSADGRAVPDFSVIKEKTSFVAVRSGIADFYTDPHFRNSWDNLFGHNRIVYHVLHFHIDPLKQVDALFRIAEDKSDWAYDRISLDLEVAGNNTKSKITSTTSSCMEIIKQRTGRYPILYSRASWVNSYLNVANLPKSDWWLAGYLKALPYPFYTNEAPPPPALPYGVDNWLIHQTGEKGRGKENGVASYYVDTNRWNGLVGDVNTYFGRGETSPVPDPEPEPPVIEPEPVFKAECIVKAINVRVGPGLGYRATGEYLRLGDIVDVYDVENNWFKFGDKKWVSGYPAYMKKLSDPIEPPADPTPIKPLYKAKVVTIPPNRLAVRNAPNGTWLRWLNSGEIVDVYQESSGWAKIAENEWVSMQWIQSLPDEGQIAGGLLNVQLWSQRDPRWANDRMGSSSITLGQEGCLVTCTASVLHYLGIDTDPKRYNYLLSTKGGYATPNLMYWLMPGKLWVGKVARAEYKTFYGTGWEATANAILADGRPALAQVDFVPGGAMNQHWVVLIGKIDGIWWCYDPWYGSTAALNARYNGIYRIVGYMKL